MAKGYWIARMTVDDAEAYKAYVEAGKAAFDKYGAKFLVRGGAFTAPEGMPSRAQRPSSSSRTTRDRRLPATTRRNTRQRGKAPARFRKASSSLVQGYDGPQP